MSKKKNNVIVKVKKQEKRRINSKNIYYFLKILVVVFLSLFILGLAKDCSGLGGSCSGRKDKGMGLLDNIVDWFEDIGDDIGNWFEDLGDDIGNWFEDLGDDIGNWFEDLGDDIGDWFEDIGNDIGDWFDEHKIFNPHGGGNGSVEGDFGENGDTPPPYERYNVSFYIQKPDSESELYFSTHTNEEGRLDSFPSDPAIAFHEFICWQVYDGNELKDVTELDIVYKKNTSYYAKFECDWNYSLYEITFYDETTVVGTPYFVGVTNEDGRLTSFPERPTKEGGYEFKYWLRVDPYGVFTRFDNIDLIYTKETVFVAYYEKVDYSGYVLNFYLDEEFTDFYATTTTNASGLAIEVPENPEPIVEGYIFSHWANVIGGSFAENFSHNSDCNYYAVFVEAPEGGDNTGGETPPEDGEEDDDDIDYSGFIIKFYDENPTMEPPYFKGVTNKYGRLTDFPTNPYKSGGYVFDAWYRKENDGTLTKVLDIDIVYTQDTIYIAVFDTADYSGNVLSFYLDEAFSELYFSTITKKDGRPLEVPNNPTSSEEGYVFSHWETRSGFKFDENIIWAEGGTFFAVFVEAPPEGGDDGGDNTGEDNTGGDNTGGSTGGETPPEGGGDGGDNTGGDNTGGSTGGETPPEGDEEDPSDIRYNKDDYLEFDPTNPDFQIKEDFYEGRDESKFYISFYILEKDNGDFSEPPGPRYYCSSLSLCYSELYDIDGDGLHDSTGEPIRECNHKEYCHCTDIALDENYNSLYDLITSLDGECVIQDCYDNHRGMYLCDNEGFACLTYGDGEFFIIGGRKNGNFIAADLHQSISSGMVFEVLPFDDYVAPYNQ